MMPDCDFHGRGHARVPSGALALKSLLHIFLKVLF